jgi:plasmid stabilization system protein ParE
MAQRKIIWSRIAYLQRKNILLYWFERNQSNVFSKKLLKQTQLATKQLTKFPYLGKPTDIIDVRVYIMGDYSLFYRVFDLSIDVVTFWDNRQDPEILKILLSLNE